MKLVLLTRRERDNGRRFLTEAVVPVSGQPHSRPHREELVISGLQPSAFAILQAALTLR